MNNNFYSEFSLDKLKLDIKKIIFNEYKSLENIIVYAEDTDEMEDSKKFIIDFENDNYKIIKMSNVFIPPKIKHVVNVYIAIGGYNKYENIVEYIPKKCCLIVKYDLLNGIDIPFGYEFEYSSMLSNID